MTRLATRRRLARERGLTNVAAGLATLALIVTACYLAFIGMPFGGGTEIKAVFASANEVGERSPVRIAGVQVGEVKKVERGPGGTAIVTMEIDEEGLPIHRDAEVKIRPRIFLEGNFFLDLEPGTPSAGELEEGDTIPLSQTAIAVQLDEILSTLRTGTRAQLRELVAELRAALEDGGAEAFAAGAKPAAGTFRTWAQVVESLRGRRQGDLAGLIEDGGRAMAAIARDEGKLAELVSGLNRTVRGLAAGQDALGRSLSELDGLLEEARPTLASVNQLVPPGRRFLTDVRPGVQAAPATLRDALPLLDQLEGLLRPAELPELRRELDPALRSLSGLEPDLTALFRELWPITECVRRNALPTLLSSVEDPPHTTGEPVYRELLFSLVGLSSASQNFDGNGPAVRYHAGVGTQGVTSGQIPNAGEVVFGLVDQPLLGSRPANPGKEPPFRPDVPCISQDPPNLEAKTGPAPRFIPLSQAKAKDAQAKSQGAKEAEE